MAWTLRVRESLNTEQAVRVGFGYRQPMTVPRLAAAKDADPPRPHFGAYGLALWVDVAPDLLIPAPTAWPLWTVRLHVAASQFAPPPVLSQDRAVLRLRPDGYAVLSRPARTTDVYHPALSPHGAVHPYLSSTAVGANRWLGRTAFHAGAFVVNGGVWGILANRDQGKTSSLAWLSVHGYPVFTDDVLVVGADVAFAGPRVLDLRARAAAHFGLGENIGVVGTRERWRARLPQVEPELPLRGWVALSWGDNVTVDVCSAEERAAVLAASRGLMAPVDNPVLWLEMLARPMLRLARPSDWEQVDSAMNHLLEVVYSYDGAS